MSSTFKSRSRSGSTRWRNDDGVSEKPIEKEIVEIRSAHSGQSDIPLTVEAYENHIWFYSDVDSDRSLALIRELKQTDQWLRSQHITFDLDKVDHPQTPIWLHINSDGGDLMSALALVDQIKMIQTPIYSVIEGLAASAASLIAMSCTRRYILPRSFVMIHQLSSMAWGTHEEFKDEMGLQDMLMDILVNFYKEHSGLKKKKIRAMLKRNTWMNAQQAFERGFVDEILSAG